MGNRAGNMPTTGPGWYMGEPYVPGGFVDARDEQAQALALVNPWLDALGNEYGILAAHLDQGDEVYDTNTFGYIPTEQQVAAAIAVANMQALAAAGVTEPTQTRSPQLAQLVKSLYQQSAALWQELSVADTEGW